jgi:hypothetical protein
MDQQHTRPRAWLEAECVRVLKNQIECRRVQTVKIRRLHPKGAGPSWEPTEFQPPLSLEGESRARESIIRLQALYALGKS